MDEVQFNLNEKGQGGFYISEDGEQLGEMTIGISGTNLTVFHTEVSPKAEGKGLAKKLLEKMILYAREQHLKVIPLCPFVYAQFKRHPADYADVWNESGRN